MRQLSLLLLLPLAFAQDPEESPSLFDGLSELPTPAAQPPVSDGLEQNGLGGVFPAFPALPPPPSLPPPNFNSPISKRVMSSMNDLPTVIRSQMEGNPKPLRNMISGMLGGGLLSKLITSPLQAAEEMGMPLEDLGFNKTAAFNKFKADLEAQNITTFIDPEGIFGEDKPTTTTAPPEETTPVMYIEGKPVKDFDAFISQYDPKGQDGKPLFKKTKKTPKTTTPNPEQLAVEQAIMRSKMQAAGLYNQQFFDPTLAGTMPIGNDPMPQPVSADIANTLDMGLIDPRRVSEVSNLLRRAPMRNPSSSIYNRPSLSSVDTLTPPDDFSPSFPSFSSPSAYPPSNMASSLDPLNAPAVAFDHNIQNVVNTLKTKSVNSLSVGEVRDLQAVLQNFEQTIKTKELLNKKRELQALGDQLEQQKKLLEEQKRREIEMKMKEQHLMEARQQIESQLQQELHSFQSGFGLNDQRPATPPPPPTPAPFPSQAFPPFDQSLLERTLQEHGMMGPEPMPTLLPETPATTRRPPTTRRNYATRRIPSTTTAPHMEYPDYGQEEEKKEEKKGGMLGGLSMGMSVVKRRPLPSNRQAEEPEEEARVIQPRVKENPFNMVRYGPEEEKKEEERSEIREDNEEKEDRAAEAPMAGGRRSMPYPRKSASPVTPAPPPRPENRVTPFYQVKKSAEVPSESTEFTTCECIQISQERMVGRWVPALASPSVISKIEEAIGVLFDEDSLSPTCAKFDFSVPRKSKGMNNAKMAVSFKTKRSSKLTKLRGNAVSSDARTIEIKLNDLHGNNISAPFCVLKAEGQTVYDYMVVVTTQGPCNEAVLFVRDPDAFFDGDNAELIAYFKHMIARKELEPLKAVPFSNDCSSV